MEHQQRRQVYRLQNLPPHVDRTEATKLLSAILNDRNITAADINIYALALSVGNWTSQLTQVATLTFMEPFPASLPAPGYRGHFAIAGLLKSLVLDSDFLGLTPLNNVSRAEHTHEYVIRPSKLPMY